MKRKKLGPGEGYEKGFTRTYILKSLLRGPEGITESDLRDILRDELGIRQRKNVTRHLEVLLKEGIVFKKPIGKGKSPIWKIKKSFETLKRVDDRFCLSEYATDYIKSDRTQEMITKEVRGFLKKSELFDENQLTQVLTIIRISPSALNLLLNIDKALGVNLDKYVKEIRKEGKLVEKKLDEIREKIFSALQIALAYDGGHDRLVSEEFNRAYFDIKTTLKHPDPHPDPITFPEPHVEYRIFEMKEMMEMKKDELKKKREEVHADNS